MAMTSGWARRDRSLGNGGHPGLRGACASTHSELHRNPGVITDDDVTDDQDDDFDLDDDIDDPDDDDEDEDDEDEDDVPLEELLRTFRDRSD